MFISLFSDLQVLGIPWDVDSDELREYMSQFGDLVEAMVMKVLWQTTYVDFIVVFPIYVLIWCVVTPLFIVFIYSGLVSWCPSPLHVIVDEMEF